MKSKIVALVVLIFTIHNKAFSQYVWFSGYSYNAPFLFNQKKEGLFGKSFDKNNWSILNNEISLANFYWLNRDYYG